jgi:hypothetical protein
MAALMNSKRVALIFWICATLVVSLGTFELLRPTAPSAPQAISATQAGVEFRVEEKNLALATGWTWPKDPTPTAIGPDGRSQVYQLGWGTTQADLFWYCTWEKKYIDPNITATERAKTYIILTSVRKTHLYKFDLQPRDKTVFDDWLNAAGKGDLSGMEANVRESCTANPN